MSEKQSTSNASQSSVTITVSNEETNAQDVGRVRLKLKKSRCIKKVGWSEETVDNEHLDKKKSKCCCIYKKPRAPEESSSSDSEDECEHCQGHVEKKKKPSKEQQSSASDTNATSMIAA